VEEQVLRLAFASDEPESLVRQSLDRSRHVVDYWLFNFKEIRRGFLELWIVAQLGGNR
jgi:hypothetical protein